MGLNEDMLTATETKSKWKFLRGLLGYLIMAYGIFLATAGISASILGGFGSPLFFVIGGAGFVIALFGFRLHSPKLKTRRLKTGFLSLVFSLISLRFVIGEVAIHADTGEPLLEGITGFLAAGIVLMVIGYFLIWPSLQESRDRRGLPILVTGLLLAGSIGAITSSAAAPFIIAASMAGIALIIIGYYIMFIREPA